MSELAFAPLARFADVVMGQSPGAEVCNTEESGLPFLQGCAEFGPRYPHSEVYCSPPLRVAKTGSVLISVRAPVGTMNYADQDYCIGRGLGAFKAKSGVSNTVFLKHAVELNGAYLHRRSQGSTFAAVSTDDVKTVPIPVFMPEKQEKIATILTGIDTAIEKTEALIAKYQQIKAGLMHDLFTRGMLPNGQMRPPREQAPELYQETAIGWIPRDWRTYPLDVVSDVLDPNPSHRNPIYHPEGFPFISTVEFIGDDEVETDTSRRVIAEIVDEQELRCKFSDSSIGFSRKGTIAEIRFLPSHLRFALLDSLCVINPKSVDASFLFYSLRSECLTRQAKNMTMGQALPQVSIGRVRELIIPVPAQAEQAAIGQRVKSVTDAIKCESMHLRKLQSQKSGLMHDLLTGKVPVTIENKTTTMEAVA
ncbi:MAG: hypothetical protein RJB34_191 [Pseudomonadota bacterium]|jgi:type I restriction enzyme S subunit